MCGIGRLKDSTLSIIPPSDHLARQTFAQTRKRSVSLHDCGRKLVVRKDRRYTLSSPGLGLTERGTSRQRSPQPSGTNMPCCD